MKKLLCLVVLLAVTAAAAYAADETLVPSSNYTDQNDASPWGEVGYYFKTGSTARTVEMFGFIFACLQQAIAHIILV